jgi:protein involved in polysaccharide export with SLBB domain
MEPWEEPRLSPPDPVFHNPPEGVIQRLQPGDRYYYKVLGTHIEARVRVSLTGTIDLQCLSAIGYVQDLSPSEFREYLAKSYGTVVREPRIFLTREEYQPRLAYVVGMERPQRTVELDDKSTLLSVLSTVLWSPGIHGETVIVFRKGKTRRIWLPHIYRYGHNDENFRILPDDVIAVVPVKGVMALGAVRNDGKFFPGGDMPLPNFLLSIGGTRTYANLDKVYVFHPDGSEEVANLNKVSKDVPVVTDGDVVFIPQKRLVKIYAVGMFEIGGVGEYSLYGTGECWIPAELRLSQMLALIPNPRFGAALDKTTVISANGKEAVKVDAEALLGGAKDQPDPYLKPGAVVYVPQTRTAHALLFIHRIANLFISQPVERESQYTGYRSDWGSLSPNGPAPVNRRIAAKQE